MKVRTLTPEPGERGSAKSPLLGISATDRRVLAVLGAFCFFLSTVEYMIPKPLPFIHIGIANLPLMIALDIFPFGIFLLFVGIKVLGQALVTGTLLSQIFLFSLAGTTASALAMFLLRRLLGPKRISFIGIGTIGALLSNLSQTLLALVFIFGPRARVIIPPFLAMGIVTGIALGAFCEYFCARSEWYKAQVRPLRRDSAS